MESLLLSATLKPTFPKSERFWNFFRYGIAGCAIAPKLNTSASLQPNLNQFCYLPKTTKPCSGFNFICQNTESANLVEQNRSDLAIEPEPAT